MKLLVADAGPLIFLAKLGRLNLLTEADVRIPAAVMGEISANLDLSEAEVIAVVKEINADTLLLDDLDARRFAKRIGLPTIGTVGILLSARLQGKISSLREEMERLQVHGYRISKTLMKEALKAAGE